MEPGSIAEWVSGGLTLIGTLMALYFSLRTPKPKITFDYVVHYNDYGLVSFKLTIINLSQIDTAVRVRGIDFKPDSDFGMHTDDETGFKYMELKSGAVLEVDMTNTFKHYIKETKDKEAIYVSFDYSDKTKVVKKIKIKGNNKDS